MSVDEILKDLETPEGKEKMRSFIEKYINDEREKDEQSKAIVSNTEYFKWLDKFTSKQTGETFCDDDWLYYPDMISAEDKINVDKLHLFYRAISEYANQNYIYPSPCDFGYYYKVGLNNVGFQIGVLYGQGTVFFCDKVKLEDDFINFEDIMVNKKQDGVDQINKDLSLLSDTILTIYKDGVPIDAIINTVNDSISKIDQTHKEEQKKLIKNYKLK